MMRLFPSVNRKAEPLVLRSQTNSLRNPEFQNAARSPAAAAPLMSLSENATLRADAAEDGLGG